MGKILVAYYSFEGFTKQIAETMATHINADILEIHPKKEIKSKGFGKYVWGGSQVMMGKKPKLCPFDKQIDDYDIILIGSPIWAGTYTPPIKSLLEEGFIHNKKVAYFYTFDGGAEKAEEKAKSVLEKQNSYLGAMGFLNPKDKRENMDLLTTAAINWVKQLLTGIK